MPECSFLGEPFYIPSPCHTETKVLLATLNPLESFSKNLKCHTHLNTIMSLTVRSTSTLTHTHTHHCECLRDIRHKVQRIIFALWKRHSLHAISPVTLTHLCAITLHLNVSRQPWNICQPYFIFMWWVARRCYPLSHTHKRRLHPYRCTAGFCHKHTFRRMQLSLWTCYKDDHFLQCTVC